MENRLDKLFKDQLSKNEANPSPQAWDQIHGQLASNRRNVWGKRLAIAASILLFAMAGIVGYRSLNSVIIKNEQLVTKSIDNDKIDEPQSGIYQDDGNPETIISKEIDSEEDIENIETEELLAEVKQVEEILKAPSTIEVTELSSEEEVDFAKVIDVENTEKLNDDFGEIPEEIEEEPILAIQPSEVLLAAHNPEIKSVEGAENVVEKKSYTQVKITYKADKNSNVLASGNTTLIDKGITKLTKFSDDHLLTAERRTKLRNTKEDLLALNFGKLLHKSTRDIEN